MLQKQNIPVDLTGSLDRKSSDKFLVPGTLIVADNISLKDNSLFAKRNGFTSLSQSVEDGTTISSGESLIGSLNHLLMTSKEKAYAWTPDRSKWIAAGGMTGASVQWDVNYVPVASSPLYWNTISVNNVRAHAWMGIVDSTTHETGWIIADEDTDNVFLPYGTYGASGLVFTANTPTQPAYPHLVTIGNYIFMVYWDSGNGKVLAARVDTTDPTAAFTTYELKTDAITGATWSLLSVAAYTGTQACVIYKNTSSALELFLLNSDGTVTANTEVTTGVGSLYTASVHSDGSDIYVGYDGNVKRFNSGLTVDWTADLSGTDAFGDVVRMAAFIDSDGTSKWYVEEGGALNITDRDIHYQTLDDSGNLGTAAPTAIAFGAAIISEPFEYNSVSYIGIQPTFDNVFLVISENRDIVSSYLRGYAPSQDADLAIFHQALVQELSTGKFTWGIGVRQATGTANVFKIAIGKASLDFNDTNVEGLEIDGSLYLSGGVFKQWDGEAISEAGFFAKPYIRSTAQASGDIGLGTYLYRTTFEFYDNNGKLYRSQPSDPTTVTVSSTTKKVTATISGSAITNQPQSTVVLWRTENASSGPYYRVGVSTANLYADSSPTTTIVDNLPDASITSQEILYTAGNVLENIFPPACQFMAKWDERLWLGGLPQARDVWYSKTLTDDQGPEFNDGFIIRFPEPVTALAPLDDKLVAFSKTKVFFIDGQGPNNQGLNGNYKAVQSLASDLGCINSNSVTEIRAGIIFESNKGIYLLNRGGSLQYLGDPIQGLLDDNSPTITSAEIVGNKHEARFTTSDYKTLVYNFEFDKWTTHNLTAVDSAVYNSTYYYLTSAGVVNQESTAYEDPSSSYVPINLTTGWIHLAGISGYKRIWEILLEGRYISDHVLTVQYMVDYDDNTVIETFTKNITAQTDFPVSIKPSRQKITAFKLNIVDSAIDTNGESLKLENITIVAGMKQTPRRNPTANRVTGV